MRQDLVKMGNGAHALAIQLLGNNSDAEDAVNDAFTRVLRKPANYLEHKGPLKPWFMRIVRNCCIDLIRRRSPGTEDIDSLMDHGPGPEDSLEIAQRDQELHHALGHISRQQREILVLRDYLDLSYAEIAVVLNIASGARNAGPTWKNYRSFANESVRPGSVKPARINGEKR